MIGNGTDRANAADFSNSVFPSGTIEFPQNGATAVISIPVLGDTTPEYDATYRYPDQRLPGGAIIITPRQTGVIRNDDGIGLLIAPLDADKLEGNSGSNPSTPFTFRVTRVGGETDLAVTTTVNYATSGSGTDQANTQDFVGNAFPIGTVTFASGSNPGRYRFREWRHHTGKQ